MVPYHDLEIATVSNQVLSQPIYSGHYGCACAYVHPRKWVLTCLSSLYWWKEGLMISTMAFHLHVARTLGKVTYHWPNLVQSSFDQLLQVYMPGRRDECGFELSTNHMSSCHMALSWITLARERKWNVPRQQTVCLGNSVRGETKLKTEVEMQGNLK